MKNETGERWYWLHLTCNTIAYYARVRRPIAGLRAVSRVAFLRHFTELCQQCGRPYPLWWDESNTIWEQVIESAGGLFCPHCFSKLAMKEGLVLQWHPVIFGYTNEI